MSKLFPHHDEIGDQIAWLQEILRDAEYNHRLSDWERNFCDDLRVRVNQYEDNTRVSPRQLAVIKKIEAKLYQV